LSGWESHPRLIGPRRRFREYDAPHMATTMPSIAASHVQRSPYVVIHRARLALPLKLGRAGTEPAWRYFRVTLNPAKSWAIR